MKKDYQATIDSAAMPVPGEVWVVMGELAGELREDCWRWRSARASR
jgi:hypothetical protein